MNLALKPSMIKKMILNKFGNFSAKFMILQFFTAPVQGGCRPAEQQVVASRGEWSQIFD
jgi:hypothetical protein